MPIHIEQMTSNVTALHGDLPLTEAQIEKLVKLLMKRMEEKQHSQKQGQEASKIRRSVIPPSGIEE